MRDDGTSPGQEPTLVVGAGALCLSSPLQPAQPRSGVRVILDGRWRILLAYSIRVRRGPEFGVWYRLGYALSRVVVTRTDRGTGTFNYSGIIGMGLGIALSNAYYPDSSVSGGEVASRFGTSLAASALSNILPEFWPDIHQKFFQRKPRPSNPPAPLPGG